MASQLYHVTGTGDVVTASRRIKSVAIAHTGAAGSCVIREGGSGGTVKITVRCPADGTGQWTSSDPDGVLLAGAIHATVTGSATIELE